MTQDGTKVLVVGATGTVGGAAARALKARGAQVRALVRSARSAEKLGEFDCVQADLRDGAQLERALAGVSHAFYVSPHEQDEEQLAAQFVAACERARVRLVFVGVHVDGKNRLLRAARRFLFGRVLAHYRPKFRIAERARSSAADPIVLMPSNFFQNDELFMPELLAGRFTQPFERAFNRVDVLDIAEAAARACTDGSLPAGAYPVVGPESLDGAACAEIWSQELGRQVRYEPASRAELRLSCERGAHQKKLEDFLASYDAIRGFELVTRADELARTSDSFGPRTDQLPRLRATQRRRAARERGAGGRTHSACQAERSFACWMRRDSSWKRPLT
ncbi:MAG: NmrA family NAD(P)-binding protein [Polyangiaceae bacterium]